MERRINQIPRLHEHLDDYDGDILGGIMANVDYIRSRNIPSETVIEDIEILPYSFSQNSQETIGADNFRGIREEETIAELGLDNFRAKSEAK